MSRTVFAGGAHGVAHDVGFLPEFENFAAHLWHGDVREKVLAGELLLKIVAEDDFGEDGIDDAQRVADGLRHGGSLFQEDFVRFSDW